MNQRELRSNFLLLITAAIWGFAFVAQRIGAQYVGSYTFNGVRFALGSLSLVPLLIFFKEKTDSPNNGKFLTKNTLTAGIIAGGILFFGASLQQIGVVYTTAGKAAFITGLYIVIVPLLGIFLKHRLHTLSWLGVITATAGLYFLSITEKLTIAKGDLYELIGALFWALHILAIDHFSKKSNALKLSLVQFVTCSILSLTAAVFFEEIRISAIQQATIPILYGGICSVGIAYTLQVIGQRNAKPSHAALIMSLETVFASIGGLLFLREQLNGREYFGCFLMLAGMVLSQTPSMIPTANKKPVTVTQSN